MTPRRTSVAGTGAAGAPEEQPITAIVAAMNGGAAGRVAPLHGEMTLSFLTRLASRYHQSARNLIAAVTEIDGMQNLTGSIHPDGEILLNSPARQRVSALCHVPLHVLERALPAWSNEEPRGRYPAGPVGRLTRGEEAVAPWGPACPACTASRTGRPEPARRYLAPQQRVCARHRYWLLYLPGTGGLPIPLDRCLELIQAQRQHHRLLRHSPAAAQAFEVARAVTGTWWNQPWPDEEQHWHARLQATRPTDTDPGWWQIAARDMITYPETITIARVLASPHWQQHTVRQLRDHRPYRVGEVPALLAELAHQLQRPWIAQRLAPATHGPLFTWVHACALTHASTAPAAQQTRWKVHSPHRPRPLSDLLPTAPLPGSRPDRQPPRRLRGHSLRAEQAFATGLLHARAYHAEHGHLAVPTHATPGGYPLGQWIVNRRTVHTQLPDHQAAALTAVDPWWNAPWSRQWQRLWHKARAHTAAHGPLQPARGFPTTSYSLGDWLYLQCTLYRALHPEQQRLLTELGITLHAAAAAKPRRRSHEERFQEGLAHAQAFARTHGSLAHLTQVTIHDGYPLGRWLASQRLRTPPDGSRARALGAIDSWWNPPWPLDWQRRYYRLHNAAASHPLHPDTHCGALDRPGTARWLQDQCSAYDQLHPAQQHLLAEIGVTADTAPRFAQTLTGAAGRNGTPPPGAPPQRSRLGHRHGLRPGFETALAHARTWHAEHGHLAVPRDTHHDGYPLGMWLFSQRNRAKQRVRAGKPPSPHLTELAAIDPWWNPPWDLQWQRSYYRARDHIAAGRPFDPTARVPAPTTALGSWTTRACLRYQQLHPDQQRLLNAIGITAQTAEQWPSSPRPRPHAEALTHAGAWARKHGHLCPPIKTVHDGFPLGEWLNRQRELAKKRSRPSPTQQALATIDPWWNPPWPIQWQRTYHLSHTHSPATKAWTRKQQRNWPNLHPDQQHLLTTLGLSLVLP